jgi:hypothetical protein
MTESRLPPPTIPLPTAAINDATMPAALFRSYARLYAAAWRSGFRQTPPLEFDRELTPLLGVRRSQAREQLRLLRFAKLLDWSSDGSNRYTIRFPAPPEESPEQLSTAAAETGFPDSVVDVLTVNLDSESIQQQHTQSGKADGAEMQGRSLLAAGMQTIGIRTGGRQGSRSQEEEQTRQYLLRAGVWPEASERLAAQIALNEQRTRMQGDQHYLPTTADVLGWMAYCFADRKKNNISTPAAMLAANLTANRRCPDEYRPNPICAICGLDADYCGCEAPELHFPPEFQDAALRERSPYVINRTLWGVCTLCRGMPCQCT